LGRAVFPHRADLNLKAKHEAGGTFLRWAKLRPICLSSGRANFLSCRLGGGGAPKSGGGGRESGGVARGCMYRLRGARSEPRCPRAGILLGSALGTARGHQKTGSGHEIRILDLSAFLFSIWLSLAFSLALSLLLSLVLSCSLGLLFGAFPFPSICVSVWFYRSRSRSRSLSLALYLIAGCVSIWLCNFPGSLNHRHSHGCFNWFPLHAEGLRGNIRKSYSPYSPLVCGSPARGSQPNRNDHRGSMRALPPPSLSLSLSLSRGVNAFLNTYHFHIRIVSSGCRTLWDAQMYSNLRELYNKP